MEPQVHPDPFREAMSRGLQRAVQVASSAVTGAQVLVHLRKAEARTLAQRDEHARRALSAQIDADRASARAEWARALDEDWIRGADLTGVAGIWGTAMPYADPLSGWHEPAAWTAMRRCEERMHDLHPYAMRHYDRLRGEQMAPADAMRAAAPFFGYAPHTGDAPYAGRLALAAGAAQHDERPVRTQGLAPDGAGRARRPWEHDFPVGIRQVVAAAATPGNSPAAPAAQARRQFRGTGQRP